MLTNPTSIHEYVNRVEKVFIPEAAVITALFLLAIGVSELGSSTLLTNK